MKGLLFCLRLGLYLLVVSLPLLHPAIAVPYDRVGALFYFVLLPWQMLAAFLLRPPRLSARSWLLAAAAPALLFVLFVSGLEWASLGYLAGAAAVFALTVAAFGDRAASLAGGLGRRLLAFEPFLPAWLAYRLLNYSRASEEAARQASGVTQLLLLLIPLAFLLHAMVLTLAAFSPPPGPRRAEGGRTRGGRRERRELALFLGVGLPLFLLLALLLPSDFVRHRIVLNRVERDLEPRPVPLDLPGPAWEGGNLLSQRGWRQGRGDRPGDDGRNQLEGIPADQWGLLGQGEGDQARNYAVMVVASPVQPVYAADAYFGHLDPEAGFLRSSLEEEPLNQLAYLRFLETWRDPAPPDDRLRREVDVRYLSTLPERYLAYRPEAVQPTVLRRQYSPFQYSFSAVSRMSSSTPRDWRSVAELTPEQQEALRDYLQVPAEGPMWQDFAAYARRLFASRDGPGDLGRRVDTVLRSFSGYRYELGYSDDTSAASMHRFLFDTRSGDCTEFSNTAAILLRLAGVPARVVTGYLASEDLQSFAHLWGLLMLRQAIPELRDLPFEQLLLVTTGERHSWVQAYLPGLGWIDLESTAHAIPPPPGQAASDMDVVIPLIQGQAPEPPPFRFPWRAALLLLAGLAALTLAGLYLYRCLAEALLGLRGRRDDARGLAALHTLLLLRLAGRGYALKPASQSIGEYAKDHPELRGFAGPYAELRYRQSLWAQTGAEERAALWSALRGGYAAALDAARRSSGAAGPGLWRRLRAGARRLLSLRGLRYL